jgi:hypothetical protein
MISSRTLRSVSANARAGGRRRHGLGGERICSNRLENKRRAPVWDGSKSRNLPGFGHVPD